MTKTVYKKLIVVCIMAVAIVACVFSLTACDLFTSSDYVAVESIQVTNSIIYMSPYGDPSSATIQATVLPSHATNQGLTYQLADSSDGTYVTVSSDGVLTASKAKTSGSILVNVFSHDDRNIAVQITVYVEEVEVTGISFSSQLITVTLGDENLAQVEPIFTPSHAVIGRDVEYSVINPTAYEEAVVTVDAAGYITPVSIGVATIKVSTPAGELDTDIFSTFQVEVVYDSLSYIMTLGNENNSVFKQIVGSAETIFLSVSALNQNCNQSPEIKWYVDNTAIASATGSKTLEYTPTNSPYGSYVLKAVLTDTDGSTLTLSSETLYMYDELTGIDLTLTSGADNLHQGEIATIQISYDSSQYPPESYFWYLVGDDGDEFIAETESTVYNYLIKSYGDELVLKCVPIIKGTPNYDKQAIIELGDIEQTQTGTDIYGLFVDATVYMGETIPHIMWDVLPYDTSLIQYTVELINDATEEVYYFTSTTAQYSSYFTINGFMVPSSVVGLEDSFTVRVKTNLFGYSDSVSYVGSSFSTEYYTYAKTIISGTHFNSYFVTMEELGEFINYISMFRPEELAVAGTDNKYSFSLCTYLDYLEIEDFSTLYPVYSSSTSADTSHLYLNTYNIMVGAFTAYADTAKFSMGIDLSTLVPTITLTFTSGLEELEEVPTIEDNTDANMQVDYGDGSRTSTTLLAVDKFAYSMTVSTSNQLYIAVSMGYKPVVEAGSAAEAVYEEARAVLLRIIDDSMTDAEKVHAIYDYLTTEVVYDYELTNASVSSSYYEGFYLEGVFLNHIAVCDGIAKAFTLLTMMEGIKSVKVIGMESLNSVGHAWNLVLVDGGWYAVDATWGSVLTTGSSEEIQTHYWLMTTDEIMAENHTTYGKYYATETDAHDIYYGTHTADNATELYAYLDEMLAAIEVSEDSYICLELKFSYSFFAAVAAANDGSFSTGIQTYIGDYLNGLGTGVIRSYSVSNVVGESEYILIKLIK